MKAFPKFNNKLRILSSLNAKKQEEELAEAIAQITLFGKRSPTDANNFADDLRIILKYMQRFESSVKLQQVACHAISNLAMQEVAARWICSHNGATLIRTALKNNLANKKLCWVATSAIWNLARVPENRPILGKECVSLTMDVLFRHRNIEKVANTAMGALSNLSLCEELRHFIATEHQLFIIIAVIRQYSYSDCLPVATSAAGLLANLAVSDELAAILLKMHVLTPLLQFLKKWDVEETSTTLHRNTCAALNNLCTAEGFVPAFLRMRGAEVLYAFLKQIDNVMLVNLLEHCLLSVHAEREFETTSFHLAAFHGDAEVLKHLISQHHYDFDLNTKDSRDYTCLDYAIGENHVDAITLLCKCGATQYNKDDDIDDSSESSSAAIDEGSYILETIKQQNKKCIEDTLLHFPVDICHLMMEWVSNVDQLQGAQQF